MNWPSVDNHRRPCRIDPASESCDDRRIHRPVRSHAIQLCNTLIEGEIGPIKYALVDDEGRADRSNLRRDRKWLEFHAIVRRNVATGHRCQHSLVDDILRCLRPDSRRIAIRLDPYGLHCSTFPPRCWRAWLNLEDERLSGVRIVVGPWDRYHCDRRLHNCHRARSACIHRTTDAGGLCYSDQFCVGVSK